MIRFGFSILLFLGFGSVAFDQVDKQPIFPTGSEQSYPDSARIELIAQRADSLRKVGRIRESIDLLRESERIVDSLNSDYLDQLVDIHLAEAYLSNDQPDSAEKIVNRALDQFSNLQQEVRLLGLLGNAYRYQGRYEEALNKQEEAKALVDSAQHTELYNKINYNIGMVHAETGNLGTAFKYYLQSINSAEATGDTLTLAKVLNSLGFAYNDYSQPEQAKYYLKQAFEINKKINYRLGQFYVTNNLAISFEQLEEFKEALSMYNRALSLQRKIRKDTPPFRILYNMGQVYRKTGELDRAEEHYQQSLEYCRQADIPQGLIYNYGGLANVAELRGDMVKAKDYYTRALNIAREVGMASLEKAALESLYDLEKDRQNFGEALTYHEELVAVSDSLENIARQEHIEETETKLELRRKEEVNNLLQEKQQQQEARIASQNWLIALSIGIISVILIFLYLLYRSNAEKQRINSELELQRNRLEDLNRVKNKMMAIIAHDLRTPMASMQSMLHILEENELSKSEMKELATELNLSIRQNISMMDNLLAWAQDQMSGLELDFESIEAYDVVEDLVENFSLQARNKDIILMNKIPPDLKVKADLNLLNLILHNLVSNSMKFSHEGDKITIRTRNGEAGKIIFEVIDTGIGIPKKEQKTIFSKHMKLRSGTENELGSGLGLQLCKEFVEKQDGEISFVSTEGKGTTFFFSLPTA